VSGLPVQASSGVACNSSRVQCRIVAESRPLTRGCMGVEYSNPSGVMRQMAINDGEGPIPSHFHAVRFYQDDDSLCQIVADFLGEGLAAGQSAVAVATPAHRMWILNKLSAHAIDVESLMQNGSLRMFDAQETLSTLLVNDAIDSDRFRKNIGDLLGKTSHHQPEGVVRVFGEMVDLLCRDGLHQAAIRLEILWNQLAAAHRFSLLCSYSMGYFCKDAAFNEICREHTHMIAADGAATAIGAPGTLR
jgi:MEDS: MEthanogen/methylotroph, DcmR Sensory domain